MTSRLQCAIPGCKRTRHNREGFSGWICAQHWAMAPKNLRRARTLAKRRRKYDLSDRIWCRCLREITSRVLSGDFL